jgi:hypothetical protein
MEGIILQYNADKQYDTAHGNIFRDRDLFDFHLMPWSDSFTAGVHETAPTGPDL